MIYTCQRVVKAPIFRVEVGTLPSLPESILELIISMF